MTGLDRACRDCARHVAAIAVFIVQHLGIE